jgi:hypothetical protein
LKSVSENPLDSQAYLINRTSGASNEKAHRLPGWAPRSPREAVLATVRSLSELGLLKSGLADTGRRALHVAASDGQDAFGIAKK